MKLYTKLFFVFAAFVSIDQLIKNCLTVHSCNKNLAWSISVPAGIFYFAWFGIIAILFCLFIKSRIFYQKLFLVLIFSGAVSNIIDRIRFGCVVDYIDLKIFPVFNLADVCITIGAVLILINMVRNKNTRY